MTISEIAKLAGVSSAAVSRYFNNGYISEEKREAIKKVVEETGYRPSQQAAMLRTKKTKQIGFIIPRIDSNSMGRIAAGVYKVLEDAGYQVILGVTGSDSEKELSYMESFNSKMVDGVIVSSTVITGTYKKAMKNMDVPVVVLGQRVPGQYCVYHDDYHAMYDMTRLVLDKGKKNPGYIGVTEADKAAGEARHRGYLDAVTDEGLIKCRDHYVISRFSINDGYAKAEKLLEMDPSIDAIITANDRIAIGALKYIQNKGLRCPEDIYVTGHGDAITTIVTEPALSSVHLPYMESGEMAANVLLDLLKNQDKVVKEVMLGYTLVDRQSTGNAQYRPSWNQD